MRKIKIETEKYYHVYNRGVGKQDIFLDKGDYFKFLWKIWELNNCLTSINRDYIWRKIQNGMNPQSQFGKDNLANPKPGLRYLKPGLGNYPIFAEYHNQLSQLPKLVKIICYSLLPNHYHFILRQLVDGGIKIFMHKLGTSYVKYFNNKYNYSGVLFQGPFKAYPINNEGKLCQLSAYIHPVKQFCIAKLIFLKEKLFNRVNCNYEIHKLGKVEDWQFSSYRDYLGLRYGRLIDKNVVLKLFFNNIREYKKYCQLVIKECQDIKMTEKMLME